LINKISIRNPKRRFSELSTEVKCGRWLQNGVTVAGGNGQGNRLNQLNSALGFCIDENQTIYIADQCNHRIIAWKKNATNGIIVAGGNGEGAGLDQLNYPINVIVDEKTNTLIVADKGNHRVVRWPRENGVHGEIIISEIACWGLALDSSGHYLYVSNCARNEVRRWKLGEKEGVLVAGGNGRGDDLHQLDYPRCVTLDQNGSIYIADWNNHRVMKWIVGAKQGIVVAGGHGFGDSLQHTTSPNNIVVDKFDNLYLVEGGNDRVTRWLKTATKGEVIVGNNGRGDKADQFNVSVGLAFDQQNNLYVLDAKNQRVQKFQFNLFE